MFNSWKVEDSNGIREPLCTQHMPNSHSQKEYEANSKSPEVSLIHVTATRKRPITIFQLVTIMVLITSIFVISWSLLIQTVSTDVKPQMQPNWPAPPNYTNYAAVCRYIVHTSEWTSLATISSHDPIKGFPFNNIFSVSDGPLYNSTGIPYFYFNEWELSIIDMTKDNRVTLTMTEAQGDICRKKRLDAEDPRCAHVMLTGTVTKITPDSKEAEIAQEALFPRHPEMSYWPSSHHWFFAKLNIVHIYMLDYFGAAQEVTVEDYFAVDGSQFNPINDSILIH